MHFKTLFILLCSFASLVSSLRNLPVFPILCTFELKKFTLRRVSNSMYMQWHHRIHLETMLYSLLIGVWLLSSFYLSSLVLQQSNFGNKNIFSNTNTTSGLSKAVTSIFLHHDSLEVQDNYRKSRALPSVALNSSEAMNIFSTGTLSLPHRYLFFMKEARHKLLYCFIPKNSCTLFKSLLYAMSNNQTPQIPVDMEPLHAEIDSNGAYKPSAQFVAARLLNNTSWTSFVILREPLERLVSAFNDKCIADDRHWCEGASTTDFKVFALRVVKKIREGRQLQIHDHYRPQHTFCGLTNYFAYYDHVLYYDKTRIAADTLRFMKQVHIEEYYYNWGVHGNNTMFSQFTKHATSRSDTQQQSLQKLANFYSKYYDKALAFEVMDAHQLDYQLLHIPHPAWVQLL